MTNRFNTLLRGGMFAIGCAAFLMSGCASTEPPAPIPEPTESPTTSVDPTERSVVTPAPTGPRVFDDSGQPLGPNGLPLSRVFYFDYDKATLSPADLASLERHAAILKDYRDKSIVIEGHCDERGTREYNLALGERRANTVMSFLTSSGVSASQIDTVSYGEERPSNPGHNDAAWRENRRAIVTYR